MLSLTDQFQKNIQSIFKNKLPRKIAVAVSGGLDSMALLVLIKNFITKNSKQKIAIFCLTIDHNVRKNSGLDAKFVADFCRQNSIECHILKSYLKNPPQVDIEGSLREVRYNLLLDFCQKNQIKNLFLAHHQQDLAENFLIRLFRGSGIDGLAAIPAITDAQKICATTNQKIKIIRPLLDFSKANLKKYLQAKKVSWVEDETNQDEKFLRNKIRKFLQTLPDYEAIGGRIALASEAILAVKNILEKQTKKQFPQIFKTVKNGLVLDIKKFTKLEKSTATRYLALALMQVSARIYKPRLKKLERIYWLIIENKLASKEQFYGCQINKINAAQILILAQ